MLIDEVRARWRRFRRRAIDVVRNLPAPFVAISIIALFACYALLLGRVFDSYIQPHDAAARKDVVTALGAFLAGTVALCAIYPTWRTWRTNQEGQITTRYTQAVSQLGDVHREVRLGGIYALERIARDSEKDYRQIIELICSYIRENALLPIQTPDDDQVDSMPASPPRPK